MDFTHVVLSEQMQNQKFRLVRMNPFSYNCKTTWIIIVNLPSITITKQLPLITKLFLVTCAKLLSIIFSKTKLHVA
jgi:hypothetical protein